MKKHELSLKIVRLTRLSGGLLHLVLEDPAGEPLPAMEPGQFVEVRIETPGVLLNRPFSIFNADAKHLELLVKPLGRATDALADFSEGTEMRVIAPLGHGFAKPDAASRVLLVGGGVGMAPFFYQARTLCEADIRPTLIYGERTTPDARLLDRLSEVADVKLCTDDGSAGFHGLVTQHPAFGEDYDLVQVCGPAPMMKAVYRSAKERGLNAQFSLENKMACGLGACLCCVEKTTTGNRCVCSEGPVFNIEELSW